MGLRLASGVEWMSCWRLTAASLAPESERRRKRLCGAEEAGQHCHWHRGGCARRPVVMGIEANVRPIVGVEGRKLGGATKALWPAVVRLVKKTTKKDGCQGYPDYIHIGLSSSTWTRRHLWV